MKQIIKIDASALKESACMLRTYYTITQGYRSSLNTIDVQYGLAFHEFIKEAKTSNDLGRASQIALEIFRKPSIMKSKKQWMTDQHLLKTCLDYWTTVVMEDKYKTVVHEGNPLVELKFAVPYWKQDDVEVILCGTIDDIAKLDGGTYVIRDYKTTSVWDSKSYFEGYRLSPQLMFYIFILKQYASLYPESLFAKINTQWKFGAMIEGIFLKGKEMATFEKSEVFFFKDSDMDEFEILLNKKIFDIVKATKEVPNREGMINGACTTVYGACKYAAICGAPDDIARSYLLKNNFITKPYDPLNFN